jgi:hypothetical protein
LDLQQTNELLNSGPDRTQAALADENVDRWIEKGGPEQPILILAKFTQLATWRK